MRTIVYVHEDPEVCVQQLYDADVIGLPITIEYTLRSVWNKLKPELFDGTAHFIMADDPWFNWVLESKGNYAELWNYAMDIVDEYDHRFGSRTEFKYRHGSLGMLNNLAVAPPIEAEAETPKPVSIEEARQLYLEERKVHRAEFMNITFSHREPPEWLR